MDQNIIEQLRKESVDKLFTIKTMAHAWPTWKNEILKFAPLKTHQQIFNLGDHLKDIFKSTSRSGRSQSDVSGGGAGWESLVCWYLNLCLIGTNTVVIKHNKQLIPDSVSYGITVNYGNFVSNTESDLIAITFPDLPEYTIKKEDILIHDRDGKIVSIFNRDKYNTKGILNALTERDFSTLDVHIIQCKTNWNDNAQVPMLWDMIYSAKGFKNNVKIGKEGYSIASINKFTYSFITVPTSTVKESSKTCINRVSNLSGGNYWGQETRSNVAASIKEIFGRNFISIGVFNSLQNELPKLISEYSYFRL